jgi:hypothetical protein
LMEELIKRRRRVRDLIETFRGSSRDPFPKWEARASQAVAHSPSV